MRVLKLIIISFVVLFFIITVISLFIPSNVRLSKAVQINSPQDSVMLQISEPANWGKWYPSNGPTVPLVMDGKINGIILDNTTNLLITSKKDNEVIASYEGDGSKNIKTGWKVWPSGTATAVEWYMDFHLRWYPWEKFSSLLFEKRYGPVLEQGLNNLKNYLEGDRSSNK